MNFYCPNCGRIISSNDKLCRYCRKPIQISYTSIPATRSTEKSKSTKIMLIIAIIATITIIATIAIAATIYIYISGMIGPLKISTSEDAVVNVSASDDRYIEIMLESTGDNYINGYTDVTIYINNLMVVNIYKVYPWTIGEKIIIGKSSSYFSVDGTALDPARYDVSVTILNTLVFFDEIEII